VLNSNSAKGDLAGNDVASAVQKQSGSGFTVLIADDQANTRDLVAKLLESRLGCRFLVASTGDEALLSAQGRQVDIVVTDLVMPGAHGLDLIAALRSGNPGINIIAMTGYPTDFPFVDVVHAGADDFIRKPFPPAELEAKLVRLFRERDARQAQQLAEGKYRSLFELNMDGMLLVDAVQHCIVDANHAFRDLSERGVSALVGMPVFDLFGPVDRIRLEQWLMICAHGGKGAMGDLSIPCPSGRVVHADLTATFIDAGYQRIIFLSFKDVTEKILFDQQLAEAAQKDGLTGLLNKRSFQNRIEAAIVRARERSLPLGLMFIDLDNFKACNDTHGHQAGDKLLIAMADVINKSVRATSDYGFRLGGDEFAVILVGADRENCALVAERMRTEFQKIEHYGTSMSIGVAQYSEQLQAETLVRCDDEALYKAKRAGKNTVHIA